MIILNLVWPALFVIAELWRAWLLIAATIVIEALALRGILNYTFLKSFLASLLGNICSALVGAFLMVWGMVLWHILFDKWLDQTFSKWNWLAHLFSCILEVHLWNYTS